MSSPISPRRIDTTQKGSCSAKKTNILLDMQCTSFKALGIFLVLAGAYNSYAASTYVSFSIIVIGTSNHLWSNPIVCSCDFNRSRVTVALTRLSVQSTCISLEHQHTTLRWYWQYAHSSSLYYIIEGVLVFEAPRFGFRLRKVERDEVPLIILLLRHGESSANVDPSVYESTPDHAIPLSERGQKMTEAAG